MSSRYGHRPVGVLEQDVRLAVAIEIDGPDYLPARVDGLHEGLGCRCRPIHQPDGDRAIGVLKENIRKAVAVEVTGCLRLLRADGDRRDGAYNRPRKSQPNGVKKPPSVADLSVCDTF